MIDLQGETELNNRALDVFRRFGAAVRTLRSSPCLRMTLRAFILPS